MKFRLLSLLFLNYLIPRWYNWKLLTVVSHLIDCTLLFLSYTVHSGMTEKLILFLSNVNEYVIIWNLPSLTHWLYSTFHGCSPKSSNFYNHLISVHCLNVYLVIYILHICMCVCTYISVYAYLYSCTEMHIFGKRR